MRELKFRAYNSFLKKFFYFSNGRYYDDTGKCISERVCSEFNWSNAEQYTGLKDKNGKDWFEGDKSEPEEGVYGVVVFKEGSFCFAWYELTERNGDEYIETTKMTDYHCDGMEVIGNINDATK